MMMAHNEHHIKRSKVVLSREFKYYVAGICFQFLHKLMLDFDSFK